MAKKNGYQKSDAETNGGLDNGDSSAGIKTTGILVNKVVQGAYANNLFLDAVITPLQRALRRQGRLAVTLGSAKDANQNTVYLPPAMLSEQNLESLFALEIFDYW